MASLCPKRVLLYPLLMEMTQDLHGFPFLSLSEAGARHFPWRSLGGCALTELSAF